jgi:hypothetical protein
MTCMDEGALYAVEAQQRLERLGRHVTPTARTPPLWMAYLAYPYLRGLGALTLALTCCRKRERRRSERCRQSGAALG